MLNTESAMHNGNNYYLAQTGDNKGWKVISWDFDNVYSETVTLICAEDCPDRMVHWSITQPTCRKLSENQLAGSLLLNETLHTAYLSRVREFVTSVLLNETFLNEISDHAVAIGSAVEQDVYAQMHSGVFDVSSQDEDYSSELAAYPVTSNSSGYEFLPFLKSRAEDAMAQLDAIEDGSFPIC